MGVDSFWKRVPPDAVADLAPRALGALVPHLLDERFTAEHDGGVLVGAEDTGCLIDALLSLGASGDDEVAAVRTFAGPPADWNDWWAVGTLGPDEVRRVARFLAGAPLDAWIERHRAALAAEAKALGYRRPFDDEWAAQVLGDAKEVAGLFVAAAARDEVVIVAISA